MSDAGCVALLRWALPRLGRRWRGYQNVRGQVCKRIQRRIAALGLADTEAYRQRLEADPEEWKILDSLCIVTISRFYRDQRFWDVLGQEVLPEMAEHALAARETELPCWSLGCASGEEPYTLSILWQLALAERYPKLSLRVLASDVDAEVLRRAERAVYAEGTLRDVPQQWLEQAFERVDGEYRVRDRFRAPVELRQADVRASVPDQAFRVIFCKNLLFTYFDESEQRRTLERVLTRLVPGGAFVIGPQERLLEGVPLEPWHPTLGIHRFNPTSRARDCPR